jgi:hypothetical protein
VQRLQLQLGRSCTAAVASNLLAAAAAGVAAAAAESALTILSVTDKKGHFKSDTQSHTESTLWIRPVTKSG